MAHDWLNKSIPFYSILFSLFSTFVVRYLDSIIPILAKSKISRLQLVSVAEQVSLSLTWWEMPKTGFLATRLFLLNLNLSLCLPELLTEPVLS